ncbi:phosphodiester glycosidase family protein [Allokutzneria multivorans]|uniref:Phosphodiester glycosidase family protein n=1 Tax=Allokutzneria multivorans TaxID=1142134 RepID=A0ABP7S649_9PSEU
MRTRGTAVVSAVLAVLGLTLGGTGLGVAAPTAALGPEPVEGRPGSSSVDGPVQLLPQTPAARVAATDEDLVVSRAERPIAPGLALSEFRSLRPTGWIQGDVLTADLSQPSLKAQYLSPGPVAARTVLTDQAARTGAIAGVNGDFFDINETGAPRGIGIDNGALRHAPASGWNHGVGINGNGVGRMLEVFLQASVTLPNGSSITATNFNSPDVAKNGVGIFTSLWGTQPRSWAAVGANQVREVEIRDGVVSALRSTTGEGPIAGNTLVLLGIDTGARSLEALRVGDKVDVRYQPRHQGDPLKVAIGGNLSLLRDGVVLPQTDTAIHPRTAVGFSADGRKMWLVTIDGRQVSSRGMTYRELGEYMKSLGADDALNLDGGGSSTLVARLPGQSAVSVHNSPSDGGQRIVPNGLGLTSASGSGRLTGFRVEPGTAGDQSNRVLAGLSRTVGAWGHDETGSPVNASPRWKVSPSGAGKLEAASGLSVFRAGQPGAAKLSVSSGSASGELGMTVLGAPVRVDTDTERVSLSGLGASGRFRVMGQDTEGFTTWVEPRDVQLSYDQRIVHVTPDGDGFAVSAAAPSGGAVITVNVGGLVTHFGVTIGTKAIGVSTMDSVDPWNATVFPAVVGASLSTVEGRTGNAIALDYRLTGATVTRAAYVNARTPIVLPAGTQRVGTWVNGDGKGTWLRLSLLDSTGTATVLDLSKKVDWTGWRYVDTEVPPALTGELRVQRLYVVETDGSRQYEGRLLLDDLTASVASEISVPADAPRKDRVVVTDGDLPAKPGALRVAVVSDAQFTSDNPEGPLVAQARRTFREALAAKPDVLLINGDLVDRGTAADFALARKVIDEELVGKGVPWYYLPGNHETYGPGTTEEFRKAFGDTFRVVNQGGVRMVLLDSSLGTLRAGGFDQIKLLRQALDSAATDPSVRGVLVAMHHPVDDPLPGGSSELTDPLEGPLLSQWLADFRARSGKTALSIASHAGLFHAGRTDGVPFLINGNSGKAPAAAPADGGFTGWTMVRIDPAEQRDPVRSEIRAHVDRLELAAPARLAPGSTAPAGATVLQGQRRIAVGYPVSADWFGSANLHIGPAQGATSAHSAAFDPATGTLTALRTGKVELGVVVNGVRTTAPIEIS